LWHIWLSFVCLFALRQFSNLASALLRQFWSWSLSGHKVHDANNFGQQACKLTVSVEIVYAQLGKLDTKTENCQQNNEEHKQGVCWSRHLGSSMFLHLPVYPHPPHYNLRWGWNNFKHTQAYMIHNFYMPNNKPCKWYSLYTTLQPSYSITFPRT